MTSPATGGPHTALHRPLPQPAVRVGELADLVASIPVLVGFRPRDSLVLISLGGATGSRIGLTMRVDLPPPEGVTGLTGYAASALLQGEPESAVAVVIGARPRLDVLDAVGSALRARGVEVSASVWTERVEAGARWRCLDGCCCAGLLPDPASTALAVSAVASGQVVYRDRAELERLVAPDDPDRIGRLDRLLRRRTDDALAAVGSAAPDDPDVPLALLADAVRDAGAGLLDLDDERTLALSAALAWPQVRDAALLRWSTGPAGPDPAAEALWAALCRGLPDPEAAEPAALLAASALLRGDGALANVALDRAERAWPGHRLSVLLGAVAQAGLHPSAVRECLLGEGRQR